jgi:hypothetical protein
VDSRRGGTRSDDTLLEDVVAAAEHVVRVLPAGPPADPFIDGIFGSAIPPIASVYYGAARRAFDLAVENAKARTSTALNGKSYAHHPQVQLAVAQAAIELDSIEALLERAADEWWCGVDHGEKWPAKLLAAKQHGWMARAASSISPPRSPARRRCCAGTSRSASPATSVPGPFIHRTPTPRTTSSAGPTSACWANPHRIADLRKVGASERKRDPS